MEWRDEAILLSARPHGETSVIAAVFTRERGRHLGLVRGGRSRRLRPILQPGNLVQASWRARLDEHLGTLTLELNHSLSSLYFDDPMALSALSLICAHMGLLAERDPHPLLYDGARYLLSSMEEGEVWPGLLARFEMEVLSELGFQLDLTACAATGGNDELIYVSPKTGRAVSASAGEPYKDKLLALPAFLSGSAASAVTPIDLANAFKLTGYFFEKHIYSQRGDKDGAARLNFLRYFKQQNDGLDDGPGWSSL